jgi:hypothetical protein
MRILGFVGIGNEWGNSEAPGGRRRTVTLTLYCPVPILWEMVWAQNPPIHCVKRNFSDNTANWKAIPWSSILSPSHYTYWATPCYLTHRKYIWLLLLLLLLLLWFYVHVTVHRESKVKRETNKMQPAQNTVCGSTQFCSAADGHNDARNMLRQMTEKKNQISCILLVSLFTLIICDDYVTCKTARLLGVIQLLFTCARTNISFGNALFLWNRSFAYLPQYFVYVAVFLLLLFFCFVSLLCFLVLVLCCLCKWPYAVKLPR